MAQRVLQGEPRLDLIQLQEEFKEIDVEVIKLIVEETNSVQDAKVKLRQISTQSVQQQPKPVEANNAPSEPTQLELVNNLHALFPSIEESIVRMILEEADWDASIALEKLPNLVVEPEPKENSELESLTNALHTTVFEKLTILYYHISSETIKATYEKTGFDEQQTVQLLDQLPASPPPDLQSSSNQQQGHAIEFLKDTFPEFDSAILEIVLEENGGDLVLAVDALLPLFSREQPQPEPLNQQASPPTPEKTLPASPQSSGTNLKADSSPSETGDFQLKTLQEMFPDHSIHELAKYLARCNGVVQDAIYQLLGITPSLQPIKQKKKKNKKKKRNVQRRDITDTLFSPAPLSPWTNTEQRSTPDVEEVNQVAVAPTLACRLKLKKLQEQFSWIDPDTLSDIFTRNKFLMQPTLRELTGVYGMKLPEKPQTPQSPQTPTVKKFQPSKQPTYQDPNMPQKVKEPVQPISFNSTSGLSANGNEDLSALTYDQLIRLSIDAGYMRNTCFRTATEAFVRGDGKLAREMSLKGRNYAKKMANAQEQAALRMASNVATSASGLPCLDLHGFHVEQAIGLLDGILSYYKTKASGPKSVRVVTGAGNHSTNNARIKPAVQEYLHKNRLQYVPMGEGAFIVTVK